MSRIVNRGDSPFAGSANLAHEHTVHKSRNEKTAPLIPEIIARLVPEACGRNCRWVHTLPAHLATSVTIAVAEEDAMPALIEAQLLDCLAPGKGIAVTAGNNTVALFKIDAAVYAIEAWCLRCGASLADGWLEGRVVACCGCDWCYNVTTGSVAGISALRLHSFDVKVVGGQVVVTDA